MSAQKSDVDSLKTNDDEEKNNVCDKTPCPLMKETKIVRYWNEDLQRPGKPHKVIEIW